jgi:FHS family glucose/mannose:H+ symporter-like MFS transporter
MQTSWPLILLAYLSLFSLGLLDNARSPYFADILTDLQLSNTEGSLFFATVSSMAFFTAWAVPRLVEKFSLIMVVRFALLSMGIGFALVSRAQSLLSLIFMSVIFGLGFGILNVAQNLLILEGASSHMRRRLFSGLHGMYAFSSWLAPLIAAQLFRLQVSWREAFLGYSSVVVLALLSSFWASSKSGSDAQSKANSESLAPSSSKKKLKLNSYGLIGSIISFYVVAELIIATRLPLYMRTVYEYTPEQAANLLAGFFLLLLIGRFLFLFIPFRSSNLKIIEISLWLTLFSFLMGLLVHPWLFVLAGLTMAPVFGLSIDTVAEMFPEFSTQAVSSVIGLTCVYIVSMHILIGMLTDWLGIAIAMYSGVFCVVIAIGLLQLLRRPRKPWRMGVEQP